MIVTATACLVTELRSWVIGLREVVALHSREGLSWRVRRSVGLTPLAILFSRSQAIGSVSGRFSWVGKTPSGRCLTRRHFRLKLFRRRRDLALVPLDARSRDEAGQTVPTGDEAPGGAPILSCSRGSSYGAVPMSKVRATLSLIGGAACALTFHLVATVAHAQS